MAKDFSSIKYPVGVDTASGQWAREDDYAEHVDQLIRQLLFTNPGERINRPDFGCGLRRMLFAPNSDVSATLAQVTVFEALQKWLNSVIKVDSVKVEAEGDTMAIRLTYTLRALGEKRYLNLEVTP